MGDMIPSFCELLVKRAVDQRRDLVDGRSAPFFLDLFTVIQFVLERDGRRADLLNAVCSMGIKIRKTEDPAVINLHLMRRPCIQRQVFNSFDLTFQNRFRLSFRINANYIR